MIGDTMNFEAADRIAGALLYEGYLLYPYRSSAVKNQRRWTFGCLFPPEYPQESSCEGSFMQVECLLRGDSRTEVEVKARFLSLAAGEQIVERQYTTSRLNLLELLGKVHRCGFDHAPFEGAIDVSAEPAGDNLFKLGAQLRNLTPLVNGKRLSREEALPRAFLSAHLVLGTGGGEFLSMQDPPEQFRGLAESCRHVRAWPVLVGDPDRCDTMLAPSIILSDFPQIAAESPGDLFDSTEMDEMLTLRIQTLTPDEKRELAALDARAEVLLNRSEALNQEQLLELHGRWSPTDDVRSPIASTRAGDEEIAIGMHVRLRPRGRADVFDLSLDGMTAEIIAIEQDFDGRIYLSVVIDDDPGRDLGAAGKPGHRFHFRPDEIELLEPPSDWKAGPARILIAGIGNIFLGDDAFGIEVVRRLAERVLPGEVAVKDFGIRGFDLACALQEGYDAVILVDAIQRDTAPGTLHVIEPNTEPRSAAAPIEMHLLDPARVIQLARRMGGRLPLLRLVGCEPATLEPTPDGKLSDPVHLAVPGAMVLVETLIEELLKQQRETVR
jgi:hydrogenase maturation protease